MATWSFILQFVQDNTKNTFQFHITDSLWEESTFDRGIIVAKGQ